MIMVDISLKASHEYWRQFPDSSVYQVILLLEKVEKSFYDGQGSYEDAMDKLGDAIDLMNTQPLKDNSAVLEVLAYTKTSRYLRILQGMDNINPGSASKVIQAAEQSKPDQKAHQLFLRRNIYFERYRLLKRVLSKQRLDMMADIMDAG